MTALSRVLTVNAGSTSLKLVEVDGGRAVGEPRALDEAFAGAAPAVVAHRVVHGGERRAAAVVDDGVVEQLRALTDLAPLHQPPALDALARCRARWPEVPNVACFDTAFHTTIPEAARTYALPARWRRTVKVYGFHGLSHAWSVRTVGVAAPECRRVVVAHLGGGQSLCGALDGRSAVTTMGFTPTDGLVMATRSGTVDPGAVVWLQGHTDEDVGRVLEQESGLLGLCGTGDMREVLARRDAGDADAQLAFAVWLHRFVTQLGGCVAALHGVDALVFTGGIGEHSAPVRAAVARELAWLGVAVADEGASVAAGDAQEITAGGARVRAFVVPAREDLQLATEGLAAVGAES